MPHWENLSREQKRQVQRSIRAGTRISDPQLVGTTRAQAEKAEEFLRPLRHRIIDRRRPLVSVMLLSVGIALAAGGIGTSNIPLLVIGIFELLCSLAFIIAPAILVKRLDRRLESAVRAKEVNVSK